MLTFLQCSPITVSDVSKSLWLMRPIAWLLQKREKNYFDGNKEWGNLIKKGLIKSLELNDIEYQWKALQISRVLFFSLGFIDHGFKFVLSFMVMRKNKWTTSNTVKNRNKILIFEELKYLLLRKFIFQWLLDAL